jgi:hypothetical protein
MEGTFFIIENEKVNKVRFFIINNENVHSKGSACLYLPFLGH